MLSISISNDIQFSTYKFPNHTPNNNPNQIQILTSISNINNPSNPQPSQQNKTISTPSIVSFPPPPPLIPSQSPYASLTHLHLTKVSKQIDFPNLFPNLHLLDISFYSLPFDIHCPLNLASLSINTKYDFDTTSIFQNTNNILTKLTSNSIVNLSYINSTLKSLHCYDTNIIPVTLIEFKVTNPKFNFPKESTIPKLVRFITYNMGSLSSSHYESLTHLTINNLPPSITFNFSDFKNVTTFKVELNSTQLHYKISVPKKCEYLRIARDPALPLTKLYILNHVNLVYADIDINFLVVSRFYDKLMNLRANNSADIPKSVKFLTMTCIEPVNYIVPSHVKQLKFISKLTMCKLLLHPGLEKLDLSEYAGSFNIPSSVNFLKMQMNTLPGSKLVYPNIKTLSVKDLYIWDKNTYPGLEELIVGKMHLSKIELGEKVVKLGIDNILVPEVKVLRDNDKNGYLIKREGLSEEQMVRNETRGKKRKYDDIGRIYKRVSFGGEIVKYIENVKEEREIELLKKKDRLMAESYGEDWKDRVIVVD